MIINVKGYHHDYPVHVEHGLLSSIEKGMDTTTPTIIITDDGVPDIHIALVRKQLEVKHVIAVPAGEQSKSFDSYQHILLEMQKIGVNRSDRVLAVGGGMVSDLAGFVAATYKRGLAFSVVPTTLLSMVDASVGGKVAINTKHAKNSVGTFYTPESVLIDPLTLETLPKRHFSNGMAEVIKTALIGDADLFEYLKSSKSPMDLSYIIKASIEVKRRLVEEDPLDKGKRSLLNYGHTIGHAIEAHSHYRFLHGECVAMGMRMMARGKPFERDLIDLLRTFDLEQSYEYDSKALMKHIREDKKNKGDHLLVADVEKPGNGYLRRSKFEELSQALKGGMHP